MFKRSPSRNNRSKGFRVRHVLQICLLIGVCFWLIYQVKHSHDKKKEFDKNDVKTSIRKSDDDGSIKLGRKGLHPDEDITKTQKLEEEEISGEEEDKHEDEEQEEEQNKHEVEEQEEEENKNGEVEEEGRGGGDDEIDENDQERKEGEGDHDEDFIDEEKEREEDERESEDKESQVEDENSSEDQDNDGGSRNTHEAREEHYKADDASSAVTHDGHDTQTISTETQNVSSENSNEKAGTNNLEMQKKSSDTEDVNWHENESELTVKGGTDGNGTSNIVAGEQKIHNDSADNVDGQVVSTLQSNGQQEAGNNSIQVGEKASNGSTVVTAELSQNVTERSNEMSDSSLQNGTESVSYSGHPQNVTMGGTTTGESKNVDTLLLGETNNSSVASKDNESSINSTISSGIDDPSEASGQFLDSSNKLKPDGDVSGKISSSDGTAGVEEGYRLSVMKGNTDATQNEKSDNESESNGTNESSDSMNGMEDSIQHDPIDSSDTHISQDEKEVRTDLGTLPEIRTERDESEEATAE